jgi:hypothetical protein
MKRGVEIPGHKQVKAAIQRHPAMLCQFPTSGCLPCQYGTTKSPQTPWRRRGSGVPPPIRRREPTPELTLPLSGMSPAPSSNISRTQTSQIFNLPAGYRYSHKALPCAEFFDDDGDAQHDTVFDSDKLTDEG